VTNIFPSAFHPSPSSFTFIRHHHSSRFHQISFQRNITSTKMPRNHPKKRKRGNATRKQDRTFKELAPYGGFEFEAAKGDSLLDSRSARHTTTALHVAFGRDLSKGRVDLAFADLMTAGAKRAHEHDEHTVITFWDEVKSDVDWAKDMPALSVFQLAFLLIDGRRRWKTTARAKYETLFGHTVPAVDHFLDMMVKFHSHNFLLAQFYEARPLVFHTDEDDGEAEDKEEEKTASSANSNNKRKAGEIEGLMGMMEIADDADHLEERGPIGSEVRRVWAATKRRRRWGAPWVPTRDEFLAGEVAKSNF
jgi:hypothetical protein